LKISASSSAAAHRNLSPAALPRKSFALLGQSVALDPLRFAVRRDLADIRLADRVFAPHYAAAVSRVLITQTDLRQAPEADSAVVAELPRGTVFEVLEFVAGRAWGRAPAIDRVGYLDTRALSWPTS
jgi:hypothetical protein